MPLPESVAVGGLQFSRASMPPFAFVIGTIELAVPVARMELLDEVQMEAVNRYAKN